MSLQARQKHLLKAYHDNGFDKIPRGQKSTRKCRDFTVTIPEMTYNRSPSKPQRRFSRFRGSRGPPSWNDSLELHHYPLPYPDDITSALGHVTSYQEEVRSLPHLRTSASTSTIPFDRTNPLLTPIVESPLMRSKSSPALLFPNAASQLVRIVPADGNGSPDTDKTSITEWPSGNLEGSTEKLSCKATQLRPSSSSRSSQTLASIINFVMRGGANNVLKPPIQRPVSTLSAHNQDPGPAPNIPVPATPVKINGSETGLSKEGPAQRGLSSRLQSGSSLNSTTNTSILDPSKYSNRISKGGYNTDLALEDLALTPYSSRTSEGPSIFEGLSLDWLTPPAAGLTSPAARRHSRSISSKRLSCGAGRDSASKITLKQSRSGRTLREGSLVSLATLGVRDSSKDLDSYISSSPPGGVSLSSSPLRPRFVGSTSRRASDAEIMDSRNEEPVRLLNQNKPNQFVLRDLAKNNQDEAATSHASRQVSWNTPSRSIDSRSLFHWDFRPTPKGPRQISPPRPASGAVPRGHRRQNCIHVNYLLPEVPSSSATPRRTTAMSALPPIASTTESHAITTPRPPSIPIFSPASIYATPTLPNPRISTASLASTGSRFQHYSPTLAMVNYYTNPSNPPSPSITFDETLSPVGQQRGSDIFTTSSPLFFQYPNPFDPPSSSSSPEDKITPTTKLNLCSLREPPPPAPQFLTLSPSLSFTASPSLSPTRRKCPTRAPRQAQSESQLRMSVLALRRMNSELQASPGSRGQGVGRWLTLSAGGSTPEGRKGRGSVIGWVEEGGGDENEERPRKVARFSGVDEGVNLGLQV